MFKGTEYVGKQVFKKEIVLDKRKPVLFIMAMKEWL